MNESKPLLMSSFCGFVALLFIGVLCSNVIVFADGETGGHVSVNVPVSCLLTGDEVEAHSKSILNGTNESEIGSTILTASCNDDNGFALYTIGFTDDTEGKNVLTNSTLGSEHDIISGTATSGNVSNWSMMVTPESNPTYNVVMQNGFNTYRTIPDSYTMVAKRESATDAGESATGANLTATYQTYVSRTQMAGDYSGQVKFVLVHPHDEIILQPQPCAAGNICYHPNGGNVLGAMGDQAISTSTTSATLYASNFKRDGYGFAGWSDVYDYETNPNAHFYGPNQTITFTAGQYTGSNKGLSLYAVWVKSTGSLQDSTKVATLCGTGTGSLTRDPNDGTADLTTVTALTDDRDNNTYAIAKLADGKCWMIENLRLADKDSNNNDIILTSQNTHNPSLPLTNTWWFSSANNNDTVPTSNHLSPTTDPTQTAWCKFDSTACNDQSMVATNNTTLFTNNTASNYSATSNVYSYGNYHNWYSATAGHGKYGSDYGQGYYAGGDICPAGWHLPKGGDKSQESVNEFWQLIVTGINNGTNPASYDSSTDPYYAGTPEGSTASNALRTYPNNFVYSGYVNGSSIANRNSYGSYWSASGYNSYYAYGMLLYDSFVNPGTNVVSKYIGRVVRCVSGN